MDDVIEDIVNRRAVDIALAIASAAIIAGGVLVLGWSVFIVIALFWFENVIIGALNVAKMLISGARLGGKALIGAVALSAFFAVHYGLFTVVHGDFVVALFGRQDLGVVGGGLFTPLARMLDYLFADRNGWLAITAILAFQLTAFVRWWTSERVDALSLATLMFAPYGRIMILHVTLLIGGILSQTLNLPVVGALMLVALKLAFDLSGGNWMIGRQKDSRQFILQRLLMSRKDDARRS